MTKVFITNFTGHSYKPAEKFGELVYITHGFVDFKDLNSIKDKLSTFINQATPDDYLLLSGNNLLCSIATHNWIAIHNKCKVLHWNGLKGGYDLYTLI